MKPKPELFRVRANDWRRIKELVTDYYYGLREEQKVIKEIKEIVWRLEVPQIQMKEVMQEMAQSRYSEKRTELAPSAEVLLSEGKEKELLRRLIIALADHPQVRHYLWKHHIIYEEEG